jgi:uncharacterized membrane protein YfcA
MEIPFSLPILLLASVVVFAGTVVQGSTGFGLGTLGVPLLVLLDPVFVPGPVLLIALVLTILMTLRERHSVRTEDLKWGIVGRFVGSAAAALLLRVVPKDAMALVIGILVIAGLVILQAGRSWRITRPNLVGAGALSGFMGTAASVGGPPMAMLYYDQKGPEIRGTLSAIFIAGTVISIAMLVLIGRLGGAELVAAALMIPSMLFGFAVSRRGASFLDRGYVKPAIVAVSAVSALLTIAIYLF